MTSSCACPAIGEETIVACATAQGCGGVAVVRLSGPESHAILRRIFRPSSRNFTDFEPRKLHHGHVVDRDGVSLDEVLCVFMPGPNTFTGEDVAEIDCHGGPAIVREVIASCLHAGAIAAQRGEFTRRAYVNGRLDLSQAEAVAEMIAAPTREALTYSLRRLDGLLGREVGDVRDRLEGLRMQVSLAVDFPDDEVESLPPEQFRGIVSDAVAAVDGLLAGCSRARLVEDGATVVLAGSVNAGKSSLMNALLGRDRALVTSIAGTTRDYLEERMLVSGIPVRLIDTAGLRDSVDPVEALGIERSRRMCADADCIVLVIDGDAATSDGALTETCPDSVGEELLGNEDDLRPMIVVWNKTDLASPAVFPPRWAVRGGVELPCVALCARSGDNLSDLVEELGRVLTEGLPPQGDGVSPNVRQAEALRAAREELLALTRDIDAGQSYDLLSVRLDTACAFLGDVIGLGTAQDVLNNVFSSFCIGK